MLEELLKLAIFSPSYIFRLILKEAIRLYGPKEVKQERHEGKKDVEKQTQINMRLLGSSKV